MEKNLGDLRVGYGRMQAVYMKNMQDSEHVILDNDFRLDQDYITRKNGDKEKISKGVLSIVVRDIDLDLDELISKLKEIKKNAVDKTEINNLIEEIPTFFTMDHEGREDACEIVAARVENLEEMEGLALETCRQHENFDSCKETLEQEQERMGRQRIYPKDYFHNGDQEQLAKLGELVNWIKQNDAYRDDDVEIYDYEDYEDYEDYADYADYEDDYDRDVKDDLLRLLHIYEKAIRYSGNIFLFKLLTECFER